MNARNSPKPMASIASSRADERFGRCSEAISRRAYKVVSFDLFDTLVLRNVLQPQDLFHYLEADARRIVKSAAFDFSKLRIEAERRIRNDLTHHGRSEDPTLDSIYADLATRAGLSEAASDELKSLEIQAEVDFCRGRPAFRRLYERAVNLGKKVIICTDTYLSREAICAILAKCGYPTDRPIFVSNEEGATKKHGGLFHLVGAKLQVQPEEILHIGDNIRSDVKNAQAAGWKALHVPASLSHLVRSDSGLRHLYSSFDVERRLVHPSSRHNAALIVSRAATARENQLAPKITAGEHPYEFGYAAVGPFVLSLSLWLLRLARRQGIDRLFFLARDGFLPIKAVQLLQPVTEGRDIEIEYLPISRNVLIPYMLSRPGGLESVLRIDFDPHMTLGAYVTERLGVKAWEILTDELKRGGNASDPSSASALDSLPHVLPLLRKNAALIAQSRMADRTNLTAFYRSRVREGERSAVFDVGRKGTFQVLLSEITGANLSGYYVVTDIAADTNIPGRDYVSFLGTIDRNVREKNPDTVLYESFLSERAGRFIGFDKNLQAVRAPFEINQREATFFAQVHAGALAFVSDAIKQHGTRINRLEQSGFYASLAIENCMSESGYLKLFDAIRHEDGLSTTSPKLLADYFRPQGKVDRWLAVPPKRRQKRLLLYCPAMTRIRGGAERVTARLCWHLASEGYEILLVSSGKEHASSRPVYDLPLGVIVRNIEPSNIPRVEALVEAFRPDAALVLASGSVLVPLSVALLKQGVPYMLCERAEPVASHATYWKNLGWEKYVLTYESATAVSVQFSSFCQSFPASLQQRIRTLPNPIKVPDAVADRREKLILCVGRVFLRQKQQHLVVEAFAQIAGAHPDWKVEIYGEPYDGDQAKLEKLIVERGLRDRVTIFRPVADIERIFSRASIFVFPSAFEGFPNALAEALAYGLPSLGLATCPGTNELIKHGVNGFLAGDVHVGDDRVAKTPSDSVLIESLARHMTRLMTDAALRERMSKQARESMAIYSEAKALSEWSSSVRTLLKSDGRLFQTHRLQALVSLLPRAEKVVESTNNVGPLKNGSTVATAALGQKIPSMEWRPKRRRHKNDGIQAPVKRRVGRLWPFSQFARPIRDKGAPEFNSLLGMADEARDRQDWGRAASAYGAAVELNSSAQPIWVQYGHALKECGLFAEAEEAYLQAIDLAPTDPDPVLHLAHLLKRQGDPRAIAVFVKLSELTSDPDLDNEISSLRAAMT